MMKRKIFTLQKLATLSVALKIRQAVEVKIETELVVEAFVGDLIAREGMIRNQCCLDSSGSHGVIEARKDVAGEAEMTNYFP